LKVDAELGKPRAATGEGKEPDERNAGGSPTRFLAQSKYLQPWHRLRQVDSDIIVDPGRATIATGELYFEVSHPFEHK
jgi:hypothetical protein